MRVSDLLPWLLAVSANQLAGCSAFAADQSEHESIACESLDHCILQIGSIDSFSKYGTTASQMALAEEFVQFGEPALNYLLDMLETDDSNERHIAGFAIAHFEEIDEKYLQRILVGIDRRVPWLPRALGRIRTESAARKAVELYLESTSSPGNQFSVAIDLHGDRAIPHILEAALCETECKDSHLYLLHAVVAEMTEENRLLASNLIADTLLDTHLTLNQQANLLSLFDVIGTPGLVVEEELIDFRASHPTLAASVDRALVSVGSNLSGRILGAQLQQNPDPHLLSTIAEIGPAAVDAGPVVVEMLSHTDFEIKLRATIALGFIEYRNSVPSLVALLDDPSDVRVNWAAAESLGKIGDMSTIPVLESVHGTHWYPAVRDAAGNASKRIVGRVDGEDAFRTNVAPVYFYRYPHFGIDECRAVALKTALGSKVREVSRDDAEGYRQTLAYKPFELRYPGPRAKGLRKRYEDAGIEFPSRKIIEHQRKLVQVPQYALRVGSGWLAGSSRGEFGGELVHIPRQGKATLILASNINGIHMIGNSIVALSGLAHMASNDGKVFRLDLNSNGTWKAEPWIVLPGAPKSSWMVETGELLINTYSGGSILLSESGEMRMAPCVAQEMAN